MPPASRMLLRVVAAPVAVCGLLFGLVGALGLVAVQLLQAPVTPEPVVAARLLAFAVPALASLGLPLAALTGTAAALVSFRRAGRWQALMACGGGSRGLIPGLLTLALGLGLATAASTHVLEPAGRAGARDALASRVLPRPGRLVTWGGLALQANTVEDDRLGEVFFAVDETVGTARSGELDDGVLTLRSGRTLAGDTLVEFDTLRVPLPGPDVRVELVERTDAALRELVERMERNGKDASYEESVLLKRTSWPVAAALLLLLAPPLVLGRRTPLLALGPLGYFAAVRGCDAVVAHLGAAGSAWLPVAGLALAVAVSWWRWRER